MCLAQVRMICREAANLSKPSWWHFQLFWWLGWGETKIYHPNMDMQGNAWNLAIFQKNIFATKNSCTYHFFQPRRFVWISCEKTGSLPCPWDPFSVEKTGHLTSGGFLKWCYPQNTPKWSFLVGKPMVVGYHHFRKHPSRQVDNVVRCCPSLRWFMGFCDLLSFTHVNTCDKQVTVVPTVVAFNETSLDDLEVVDICFPTKTTPSTFNKSTHIENTFSKPSKFQAFENPGTFLFPGIFS